MPEDFLYRLKGFVKREWKIAFFSAVVIGFLTHLYVFTNVLPNHDGLLNIYSSQSRLTSGRFFLGYFSGISSYFDLPWINGVLSILYLALTAIVITELFELRKTLAIVLVSGIIITFPTIAATFSYMFTADGYMAGILLSVYAILLSKKYKYGFIPGAFVVFLSVGIYQANLPIILTVVLVWCIRELILNQMPLSTQFILLMRFVGMTAIGMGLYAFTFKAYQKFLGGEITDYQGLNQIGQTSESFSELLITIKDTTIEFLFNGFVTGAPVNTFEVLNIFLVMLIVIGVILSIVFNKVYLSPIRIIMAIMGILLLPIFAFILFFVSPGVLYHMLMVWALVPIYLLPVILYDKFEVSNLAVGWFSWGVVIVLFLTIFNFSIISNISYLNMTYKYEKSYGYVGRILSRIEQTEGSEHVNSIAIIGRPVIRTELATRVIPETIPKMTGATGDSMIHEAYHINAMLANFYGTKLDSVHSEELQQLKENEIVKNMKPWPSKDSVRILGDIAVIKLSE